ncbi:MAG TPA: thiamine pyrophosphate-dependent enzyme, partial [Thermaerobacter sp.]
DAVIPLLEAFRQKGRPRFVTARHEGAAALMASAYAKLRGRAAVCVTDAGPGAVQLLNGVYDAAMDRVPMLVLTGGLPTRKVATHWPQDANLDLVYADAAVYNHTLTAAQQATRILPAALRAAYEKAGPARVGLPVDLQREEVTDAKATGRPGYLSGTPLPDSRDLDAAVHLLRGAARPVLFVGRGARPARQAVLELAEQLDAAIVCTLPGVGAAPGEHPHYCGVIGEAGTQAAADVLGAADVAVVIGSTWWQPQFVPRGLKVIQIDNQRNHLGLTFPVEVALPGDAGEVVQALLEGLQAKERPDWRAFWERARAGWQEELREAEPETGEAREPVHPASVFRALTGVIDPEAVICLDTGQHTYWFGRYFVPDRQTVLLSGHWRTVGFALPAAIGAALAAPRRRVIAIAGDGGLGMFLAEFTTAVQERLPITVLVFNDGRYAEEEELQVRAQVEPYGTRFVNPDFAAFAEAAGGTGIRVEQPRDLGKALERALRSDRPALVDVQVTRASFSPPVPVAARDPWAARVEESEVRDEGAEAGRVENDRRRHRQRGKGEREPGRLPERV